MDELEELVNTDSYGKAVEGWADTTWNTITEIASTPALYQELLAVVGVCIFAYVTGRLLRHYFHNLREDPSIEYLSGRWFAMRAGRLIPPLIILGLLSLTNVFGENIFTSGVFINIANKLAVLWLIWICLQAFVSNVFILSVASWILLPAAGLALFGLYSEATEWLDALGFSVGEVRISALTVIKAILFATFLIWAANLLSLRGVSYIRGRSTLNSSTRELLVKTFQIILYAIVFVLTLDLIGIDLTALAVFGGALGVGLGFGLQKIASNFISGIILLMERSVRIGNLVELDQSAFGFLRKLGARASIVETYDGQEIMIPNEDFITSRVINWTYSNNQARVHVEFGVSYATEDLRFVADLAKKAAAAYPGTAKTPEPTCFLANFGESSVDFILMFWIDYVKEGRYAAKSAVMFTLWDLLKEHNIEIPFPQRDLHIRSGLDWPESLTKGSKISNKEE